MRILYEPLIGGGGGNTGGSGNGNATGGNQGGDQAPAWLADLPEDVRNEPSLKSIRTIQDLAKGYVHAQRLVGVEKIPAPKSTWTDKEWNEFYAKVGRPEAPDKYDLGEIKLEEGLTIDDERLKGLRAKFHGLGLTNKQASALMQEYAESLNSSVKNLRDGETSAKTQAEQTLRQEWGPEYENNLNLARNVIQRFGDEQFAEWLQTSGMGNDPRLVKMIAKLGRGMLEDRPRDGSMADLTNDAGRAAAEITNLKGDPEFLKALYDRQHPNNRAAVERWGRLHNMAFPGKVTTT